MACVGRTASAATLRSLLLGQLAAQPQGGAATAVARGAVVRSFTSTTARFSDKSARDYLAAWVGHTPGDRYLKTIEERMRQVSQAGTAAPRYPPNTPAVETRSAQKLFRIPTLELDWPANGASCESKLQALSPEVLQTMRSSGVLLEFDLPAGAAGTLNEVQQSFAEYRQLLQEHHIHVIGVANCPPTLQAPLRAFGVLLVNELPHDTKPAVASEKSSPAPRAREERTKTKLPSVASAQFVHGTVRSGQQVYAEGKSLVILGGVNEGAEVMADGDIHVYGRLQGRAVAGLSGDRSAKIFTLNFDAPLVGISDIFKLSDEDPAFKAVMGKAAMIHAESVPKEGSRDSQMVLQVTQL